MKKTLLLTAVMFTVLFTNLNAANIFVVKQKYQADVKVFIVKHKYQADLLVYTVDHKYKSKSSDALWFFVKHKYQSDVLGLELIKNSL